MDSREKRMLMKPGRKFLITALTFLVVLGISGSFVVLIRQNQQAALRAAVSEIGDSHAHSLETQLGRSLSATFALASVLRQAGEIQDFEALAAEMIDTYDGITNLQLAPNGVIQQIYPLAGNEAAIGHDLLNDPAQRTEALAAIESRELTLAGPIELIQGGTAVIGRLPVFLPDESGQEQFWGFANVLIKLSDLLAAGNLEQLTEVGYGYEISRLHPDTEQPEIFARSGTIALEEPVSIPIKVPNGHWQLAIAPQGGWQDFPILEAVFAILMALVVAGLMIQIMRNAVMLAETNVQLAREAREREQAQLALKETNEVLEQRVRERTAELETTVSQLEQEIAKREEAKREIAKLSKAVMASSEIIFMTDRDGVFTYVNPAFEKLYGYAGQEVVGQKTPRILKSGQMTLSAYVDFWETLLNKQVVNKEIINRARDGRLVTMSISANPILDDEDEIIGFLAIQKDITARKEAERASRQAEMRYRELFEEAPVMYVITQNRGNGPIIADCNKVFAETLGFDRAEILHRPLADFYTSESKEWLLAGGYNRALLGDFGIEDRELVAKDGHIIKTVLHASPEFDADGQVNGTRAMFVDITERERQERELETVIKVAETVRMAHTRAELAPVILEQLENLLEASGVALILIDSETGEAYAEMGLGVCVDWTGVRLSPGAGVTGMVIETGQPYRHDHVLSDPRIIRPDLIEGMQAAVCVPLTAQEERLGVLWMCRDTAVSKDEFRLMVAIADIAANAIQRAMLYEQSVQYAANLEQHVVERTYELAKANEQLQELDKLKSKFVSDVSHELRTPITNIKLYLDLMVHGRAENSGRYIHVLKHEAERLTRLVEDTLALSRLDGTDVGLWQRHWVDLNQVAGQVVETLQPKAAAAGLDLSFDPMADLPQVWAEPNQIAQVVTNLVTNALNYTPEGEVEVYTAVADDDNTVCLLVKDTGVGILPEDRQHLFDRFYRGRYAGQSAIPGTGLGLAIVKEIIDLHGGQIEVESNDGQGTIFRIYLPAPMESHL